MVEVVLALAAIAVTAAIVLGDARPDRDREPAPPEHPAFEEARPLPLPLAIETIDAPTAAYDPTALDPTRSGAEAAPAIAQSTFALPLPSAQVLPATPEHALGHPHWRPDPDRLIQTEVLVPAGNREHAIAVTRLVIGITGAGLVLGLAIMGMARAIGLLVH